MRNRPKEEVEAIRQAADLMRASKNTVVLTGAGFSTPSGVPDFRSIGSGLWTRFLPMEVASLSVFRHDPEKFFTWLRPLASHMLGALPNSAHLALAELEKQGYIQAIITQNIDGLHHRAGSRVVYEIHGTLNSMTCVGCFNQFPSQGLIENYLQNGDVPHCPLCHDILKPDIILYEEQLPIKIWNQALKASQACELMLVAGTSLEVMPSASLPIKAIEKSAHLILVNKTETYIDVRADIILRDDVADVIPRIAAEVLDG
ncbi:MAG: SIR2 family NAD-dependent protein deacylase [Omnitrophica WOR_2 bacterium]